MTAPHRRLFQFSLRTMLVVVTVAAAAMFVCRHQMQWIAARRAFIAERRVGRVRSHSWAWSLGLPGEHRHEALVLDYFASAEDVRTAKSLFPEAKVWVNDNRNSVDARYGWLGDPAFERRAPRVERP